MVDYPSGFFARQDETADRVFYAVPRLVTHIDDGAIAAVSALYEELGVRGDVLDLMSSWISHFVTPPRSLTVLGMNAVELDANPMATARVVHDLNETPSLPFPPASFDDVVCCVSVDYLVRPLEVFRSVAQVLRPGGRFVCSFSNRVFPTKAIAAWLYASEEERCQIVASYFTACGPGLFEAPTVALRTPPRSAGYWGDPLYAVWASTPPTVRT